MNIDFIYGIDWNRMRLDEDERHSFGRVQDDSEEYAVFDKAFKDELSEEVV